MVLYFRVYFSSGSSDGNSDASERSKQSEIPVPQSRQSVPPDLQTG